MTSGSAAAVKSSLAAVDLKFKFMDCSFALEVNDRIYSNDMTSLSLINPKPG